jgi:hypothetical protein
MDTPIWGFPRGDIRVSDAERDQAVAKLSEHFQAGRLTQEEFEDRSGRALQARTGDDLNALFTDLPQKTVSAPSFSDPTVEDPVAGQPRQPGSGIVRRAGRLPVARVVIACVIAAIVLGGVDHGHGHASFGWLVPVAIIAFVFLRLARRR